ncbi:MAG: porin PorA family protein [Chloroflexota bacterium]|nr:porin PorA family protein [Chloroflexota bacterium]
MFKLMFPGKKQRWGLALIAGGLILVVLGALWMAVLFPSMSKLPCDFSATTVTEGTVTVLDTQTYMPMTYNVTVTREFETVDCVGDTAYITEDVSFVDSDTGEAIPMLVSHSLMAVDRATKMFVPNAVDEYREGYWTTPAGVTKDDVFDVWVTGNPATVKSGYVSEEDFHGLHVMCRAAATPEEGLIVPATDTTPEMIVYAQYQSKCEPVSGAVVWATSTTKRTMMIPSPADTSTLIEITVYEDQLTFTDEQTEKMIEDAKEYKSQIILYGTTMPWVIIILGFLEMALGIWMSGIIKIIKYVINMKKNPPATG